LNDPRMHDTRISFRISKSAADEIRALAQEREQTVVGLLRESFGVMQVAHSGAKKGLYLGLTPHRENLETVLVLP